MSADYGVRRNDGAWYIAEGVSGIWWAVDSDRTRRARFPEDRAKALARDLSPQLSRPYTCEAVLLEDS